jgi:hypothetical protein
MASTAVNRQPTGAWPQVRSGPLIAGGILIGIGAMIGLAGAAIAGSHVISATRAWMKELEVPPSQLARLRWEQAKTAATSGVSAWREHPNAQVRLRLRRTATPVT